MLISDIFYTNRSLLGINNDISLYIIDTEIPLKLHWIPSGTKCFDWTVPKEWIIKKAILKDSQDNVIVDFRDNILHVINYSGNFNGKIHKTVLDDHVYYNIDLPDAIPYRTSYYDNIWGFCMSWNQYKELDDDFYIVDIESEFVNSSMSIGEAYIKGRSNREVILTSYICHPFQANDGLSGVQLLIELYKKLKSRDNYFTYRFFFMPETIGALALLSQGIVKPENVEYGLVATCVGYGEELSYKETFLGNHTVDNIVKRMGIETRKFQPYGSDERQFSSPNIRIPIGSLMRTPYQEYPQYHTSEDNMDLISHKLITETTDVYYDIIKRYEEEPRYVIRHNGGEPFLSKYGLYRLIGTVGHEEWEKIRNWVIFLSDGNNTISDMVIKSGYSMNKIKDCIKILVDKGVIKLLEY